MARKKKADPTISLVTAVVVESDYLKLAAYRDDIDPYEVDETRMLSLDLQEEDDGGWSHDDVELHIIAMCVWPNAKGKKRAYVALSWEGAVEIVVQGADQGSYEVIQDAGLHGEWSKDYGYLMDVAAIGKTLYACGDAGQIYRRTGPERWEHADAGVLVEGSTERCFMAMGGVSESSIYVVGLDGEIFHGDGRQWAPVASSTREQLLCLRVFSETDVVVGGANGTLLAGHATGGFQPLPGTGDSALRISSVERFGGRLYVAGNLGLFVYDGAQQYLQPVQTGLVPELTDANVVEAQGGVLWSVGAKDMACFDGERWTRFDVPGNPAIR